jgi:uncharacterized membrane protein
VSSDDEQKGRAAAGARAPHRFRRRRALRRKRTLWPMAAALVAAAILLALTLPGIEVSNGWHDGLDYDPSTAQATLAAIAGGMITLTGFVLTAVTLMVQTVQDQSSRLLQALNRMDRTPLLFGMFIATFMFALLVLGDVHGDDVPSVSVSFALFMVLVCVVQFLRMLVTFRGTLTVIGLTSTVGDSLRTLIDAVYPAPFGAAACDLPGAVPAQHQADALQVWTLRHEGQPGVFQSFDEPGAVRLALKAGTGIRFIPAVGDFVATGAPLAQGPGNAPRQRALRRLVSIGPTRTLEQDAAYGIRMLVDIAIRALSPAVNDPTSAVQALDQLDDVLHRLAGRSLGDGLLHDSNGNVVVRFPAPTWDTFLTLAVDEILLYGSGSVQVARRLRAMLEDLLATAPAARWPAVRDKLAALDRATLRSFPDAGDQETASRPDRQGIGSPR